MTSPSNALLPCPFCGHKAGIKELKDVFRDRESLWIVGCTNCQIRFIHVPSEKEATRLWNSRAERKSK